VTRKTLTQKYWTLLLLLLLLLLSKAYAPSHHRVRLASGTDLSGKKLRAGIEKVFQWF